MSQTAHNDHNRQGLFYRLKQKERQWQDEIGNQLIEESYECDGSRLVYECQFSHIISQLSPGRLGMKDDLTILEIGCGRGQFLNRIGEMFDLNKTLAVGLDLSSKLVEVKNKYQKNIRWLIADGENLPFSNKSFDAVVYNGSLHHMPNFRKAMQEAFRVTCPNGHIILYEPVSTILSRTIHHALDPFVFRKTKYESPVDEHCKDDFRLSALHEIIAQAGYTYTKSWHDFLAYPFTGCYAGSYFSNKPRIIEFLLQIENSIMKIPLLKRIASFFCWRLLIDIYKN